MRKPPLSFRPNPELEAAIRTAASEDRRTLSNFLTKLIEDALVAKRAGRRPDQRAEAA